MLRFLSFALAMALLCRCSADSLDDMLDEIIYPETNNNNSSLRNGVYSTTNLTDIFADLESSIQDIFSPTKQQAAQVKLIIDAALKRITQPATEETTTEKTEVKVKNKTSNASCGTKHECVKKWQCKTEETDQNGSYLINLRSAFTPQELCHPLEVCCYVDDIIAWTDTISSQDDKMNDCGYRQVNGVKMTLRSAQHQEAQFGEFPWVVAVMLKTAKDYEYIGGGSIIAPNIIITAAHKVKNKMPNQLQVRAGEWDFQTTGEILPHATRDVKQVLVHDNFSFIPVKNNIALLVLDLNLNANPHIAPICLPTPKDVIDYTQCIATGWGKLNANSSSYQRILKKIHLAVLPWNECENKLKPFRGMIFERSHLCAGGEKNVDTCDGDGGSALVCPTRDNPNRYHQVGIVSWGVGCGLQNVPGVYANISYHMPWITQELK